MAKQTEPKLVKSIPEGYTKEVRDGKTVYVKRTESREPSKPVTKIKVPTVKKTTTTGAVKATPPKPKPTSNIKPAEPKKTFTEDVLMLEDPKPVEPVIQKPQYLRTDIKEEFPQGLQKGFHQYSVPDLTTGGNYAKSKTVITDESGMPQVFDFKLNKYVPTGEPNVRQLMEVQADTPTIQQPLGQNQLPTKFSNVPTTLRTPQYNAPVLKTGDVDPNVPIQYKGFNDLGTGTGKSDAQFLEEQNKKLGTQMPIVPELKKGGLVQKLAKGGKIKGYQYGGTTEGEYDPNNPISGQGIIQQPGSTQFVPTGNVAGSGGFNYQTQQSQQANKKLKAPKTQEQLNREANIKSGAVSGVSALGNAAAMTTEPMNESDAKQNAAFQAIGQAGTVGAAISGIYGIANKFGTDQRRKSEQYTSTGELKDENKARTMGIVGGILDPIKAYNYRKESGNWGDVSGKGYTKFLEDKAKKQIEEVKRANQEAKIEGTIANRDAGQSDIKVGDKYDLSKVSFDENGQLILPQANYNKGGLVKKAMQHCADGGVIKGKGGPKDDKIVAKVKAGSFVVPAENTKVAETLREKLLMKAPNVKANLNQKGGEKVKLSNKEHLFTPEEKEELMEKGVDMNELAPNAENKEYVQFPKLGFKEGGPIKSKKTYKELITPPINWKGSKEYYKKAADKAIKDGKVIPSDYNKINIKAPKSKTSFKEKSDVLPTKDVSLSEIKKTNVEPTQEVAKAESKISSTPIVQQNAPTSTQSTGKRRGLADILGNVDPTALVGPAQTYLGAKFLRDSKRPDYNPVLDATINEATNKAIREAQYGLSPEERFAAEQNIQNALNDARFSARNLAGGSAGTAFTQERAAINSGLANKLNMQIADQQLRREKQQYANQLAADRAAINAQNKQDVFNIANQAFNQRQQAGAELVGAGLANTIGAYRYNRNARMMDAYNQQANPWTNYNYNV